MQITRDTTALITGANGGLGQAIARALHAQGARLVLHARREESVRDVAKELGARVVLGDLAKREDTERICKETGHADIVVANAALSGSGKVLDHSTREIDDILEVNLRAPAVMARLLAPGMVERHRGSFVFISSVSGMVSAANTALYSATKFGLRGFALGLRSDLAPYNVGVTTVFPGFIRDAGMFAKSGAKLPGFVGTRTPEEVGAAVVRAVRTDPAEIVVAAMDQRLTGMLGGVVPGLLGWVERNAPFASKLGGDIASGQRARREREARERASNERAGDET